MHALLVAVCVALAAGSSLEWRLVTTAVADLRAAPGGRPCCPVSWAHDPGQLTQLLYGDPVRLLGPRSGGYVQVEALDQPMLYNGSWSGYRGWLPLAALAPAPLPWARPSASVVVPHADVFARSCSQTGCLPGDVVVRASFGTWFAVRDEQWGWSRVVLASGEDGYIRSSDIATFPQRSEAVIRQLVQLRAPLLLGYIYSWGGRSAMYLPEMRTQFSGLDCSGFVSILYRSCGVIVPRDASKQALWVKTVPREALQVSDVFFFGLPGSTEFPVTHVMGIYSLDSATPLLFESADNATHIVPIAQDFAQSFNTLTWGQTLPKGSVEPGAKLTWGSFFPLQSWNYTVGQA